MIRLFNGPGGLAPFVVMPWEDFSVILEQLSEEELVKFLVKYAGYRAPFPPTKEEMIQRIFIEMEEQL
jgi:hypothetical protein